MSLYWWTTADLDLHVTDPYGDVVYYGNRAVPSGGKLDRDSNYPCENATINPRENIYWPTGGAPSGSYRAIVKYFGECQKEGEVEFELIIKVNGITIRKETHTLGPGEKFECEFTR